MSRDHRSRDRERIATPPGAVSPDPSSSSAPRPARPPALPPVTIGVVTHDSEREVVGVLDSLDALRYPELEVIFVDNDSSDRTREIIAARRPDARLVRLDNRGPNPARNYVLDHARHRYVLLVDDDVVFGPDVIQPMIRRMVSDPGCGTVMPRIVYHRDPAVVQYGDIRPHFLGEVSIGNGGKRLEELPETEILTPLAPGLFLLVDRDKAAEIGGFDDFYFFGKTDSDFTFRMSLAGYRNVEVPASVVRHDMAPRGLSVVFYQVRNRWYWLLKLFAARTLLVILPALLVHEATSFLFLLKKGKGGDYARAAFALLRSLPTVWKERRRVQRLRRVPDRDLLTATGFAVRADVVAPHSRAGRMLGWYRRSMELYWAFARRLL